MNNIPIIDTLCETPLFMLDIGISYLTNLYAKSIYKNSYMPTTIDEIIRLVKYAKKNNMKITVISGGHSSIAMRAFPYIKKENLLVIDMQKFTGIKLHNKILVINSGTKVKDIKEFNKTLTNYFCLHGGCDTVGMGFWLNGMSGISGIPSTFFQVGSGSEHITPLRIENAQSNRSILTHYRLFSSGKWAF